MTTLSSGVLIYTNSNDYLYLDEVKVEQQSMWALLSDQTVGWKTMITEFVLTSCGYNKSLDRIFSMIIADVPASRDEIEDMLDDNFQAALVFLTDFQVFESEDFDG